MGIFDRIQINRALATLAEPGGAPARRAEAAERLRSAGRSALPLLLPALVRDSSGVISDVMADLVNNATLPALVETGLLSGEAEVVAAVKRVLAKARGLDPNRLFELYLGRGDSIMDIAEILLARREAVSAKTALRLLEMAHSDSLPGIFGLIDQLANEAMVPPLLGFLKSAEGMARYHIARILARFPGPAVRDALVGLLADPNKAVRGAAVEALPQLGLPVPIAKVCALLRDTDLTVQSKAIEAAVRLNDPDCIRPLLEVLQDENEYARRAAVEVLNSVGNASAIKDLLFSLKDKDWWVRVRAADALGSIGGPKVIDAVISLLGDEDEFMRRTAVEILNTTSDERAFEHLVRVLRDPDWWVRERAIDALGNMGDARAVPHLVELLAEHNQATPAVLRTLAQLGDASAVEAIISTLDSQDEAIQREAVEALRVLVTAPQADRVAGALEFISATSSEVRDAAGRVVSEINHKHRRTPIRAVVRARSQDSAGTGASGEGEPTVDYTQEIAPGPTDAARTMAAPARAAVRVAVAANVAGGGSHDSLDVTTLHAGDIIGGRYRVLRELGRGGFGVVMQVSDQIVGEEIALKIINPMLIQDEGAIARFVQEVRFARRIAHPNVIRLYDFLTLGNVYAISMEFFASQSMLRLIRRGLHRTPARGLRLVTDMARGMEAAHHANVMHRDLKPANILVNETDLLKIVDFGLASATSQAESRLTKTGHLVGTPTYMSPEQARGVEVDHRADIYSMGVLMHEVFTGAPPYAADNPLAVLYQHIEGLKEAPSSRNPDLSPALEAIIVRAMAVKPQERFQTVGEMLAALEAVHLEPVS